MTDKEIKNNPRVQRLINSGGDLEDVEARIGLAYMMMSKAMGMMNEANDILDKYHLVVYNVKQTSTRLEKAFQQYHAILRTMIPDKEAKKNLTVGFEAISDLEDYVAQEKDIKIKRGQYYEPTIFLPAKNEIEGVAQ